MIPRRAILQLRLSFALGAAGLLVAGAATGTPAEVTAEVAPVSLALATSLEPAGTSELASLSTAGRYVAFFSLADNLVEGDTNRCYDAFLYDTLTESTVRVSVDSTGVQGDYDTLDAAVSGDGRYVAFASFADNLVAGDNNGSMDIFVHDFVTGETTRVSVASGGAEADDRSLRPSISADGRYVAFVSLATNLVAGDDNGVADVFVRDRQSGTTVRASLGAAGAQANNASWEARLSADGRHVAFSSYASNLVAADGNGLTDIFLRDLDSETTTLVSVSSVGVQANGYSGNPDPSADGRFVVFDSLASNLVADDDNAAADVFVRDLVGATTERASIENDGGESPYPSEFPAISDDGRYVSFQSANDFVAPDSQLTTNIFVRDRQLQVTVQASLSTAGGVGVGGSTLFAAISGDGGRVAFHSSARFWVPGDSNDAFDIFVRDLAGQTLARCPDAAAPSPPEALTLGDGPSGSVGTEDVPVAVAEDRVAFESHATNLVVGDTNERLDVFVRELGSGTTVRASVSSSGAEGDGDSGHPAISADGRWVAFESTATNLVPVDDNGATSDVFVHDLVTGDTELVSLSDADLQVQRPSSSPAISGDGRYVAFVCDSGALAGGDANGVADVFLRDRQIGTTTLVSVSSAGVVGNLASYGPAMTPDARYVAFFSYAHDLVSDADNNPDADIFVRDQVAGTTSRVSPDSAAPGIAGASRLPDLSADGRYVTFVSNASWLVADDTNGFDDVFVVDRQTSVVSRASVHSSGAQGYGPSRFPAISADGRYIAFDSFADTLTDDAPGYPPQVFLHDRVAQTTRRVSFAQGGDGADRWSANPAISGEGLRVAFASEAATLVAGDTNGLRDVFRWSLVVCADSFEDGTLCSWDAVVGGPACP